MNLYFQKAANAFKQFVSYETPKQQFIKCKKG